MSLKCLQIYLRCEVASNQQRVFHKTPHAMPNGLFIAIIKAKYIVRLMYGQQYE